MEYVLGEFIGDLIAGALLSIFSRRTTARHRVLHAVRLSRRRNLTTDQRAFAVRWLSAGTRHAGLMRLERHRPRIIAGLNRVQSA